MIIYNNIIIIIFIACEKLGTEQYRYNKKLMKLSNLSFLYFCLRRHDLMCFVVKQTPEQVKRRNSFKISSNIINN